MLGWGVARTEPLNWDYCDRSPCTRLINALGEWIYGNPEDGSYVMIRHVQSDTLLMEIRYCPFCGCRLEQLILKADRTVTIPDS